MSFLNTSETGEVEQNRSGQALRTCACERTSALVPERSLQPEVQIVSEPVSNSRQPLASRRGGIEVPQSRTIPVPTFSRFPHRAAFLEAQARQSSF